MTTLQKASLEKLMDEIQRRKEATKASPPLPPVTFTKQVTYCTECPNCEVVPDPDPYDSFCSDDEATLCMATPNTDRSSTPHASREPWSHRPITVSARPYQTIKESTVPDWCPLREKS